MTPNEYRDRVALWLHDNAGNLLVQDDRDRGLGLKFPGGGIDPGQSVNDAAIREALEEVGYTLADKPRAIPGVRARKIDWDPIFSAEAAAKGRHYKGSKHYHRMAQAGERDEALLGSEGDALKANWMPIAEVLEATRSAATNPDNKYNYFDEERLNAAEKVYEMLNQKTANDKLSSEIHINAPDTSPEFLKGQLNAIKGLIEQSSPEDIEFAKYVASAHENTPKEFAKLVNKLNPDVKDWEIDPDLDSEFIRDVLNQDNKKRYYLERPHLLEKSLGVNLGLPSDMARTIKPLSGSYPSFHSAVASYLGEHAKAQVPEESRAEIDSLVDKIRNARHILGFHTPQDTVEGARIGREYAASQMQPDTKSDNKTASLNSTLYRAYLIGKKLASADFGYNDGASDDLTHSDNEVYRKTDPKDFVSKEDHVSMTPSTTANTWAGHTEEAVPSKTENTPYKRDHI